MRGRVSSFGHGGLTFWILAASTWRGQAIRYADRGVPALAVLMSWALLGEVPGWLALAGGALCLTGVAVTRWAATTPQPSRIDEVG